MSARQYEFRDGHFVDTWNEGYDDTVAPPGDPDGSWPEALLESLCGCGNPELVVEAMAAYLLRVEASRGFSSIPSIRSETPDLLADYLLASMACDLGFAEHGGSIYYSWLTDAGKRWLQLWHANPGAP